MVKQIYISLIFSTLGFFSYSQCETLDFAELGYSPAYCRTASYQSGQGVVYAAATGGTPDYTYEWINLETGYTNLGNTTWSVNAGDYTIKVTDDIGCVITAIIKVDSIIPIADFTITSIDLDTNFFGFNSAEVTVLNTSSNWGSCWTCAEPSFPMVDTMITMSVDGAVYEHVPNYSQIQTILFDQVGNHQICVAATNKNHCTDTLCKEITIVAPVSSQPTVNITTSSITGDFFIELLIPYPVILNMYDFSGTPISSQTVVPGFNTFNFTTGQYIYDVVDPNTNQILVSGTFFVL